MIGVYDYTVLATYLSLAFGVSGILAAMNGSPYSALLCLMVSGLLDAFDGRIARTKKNRTEQEKRFGIQIDSLNDVALSLRLGSAPTVIYAVGLTLLAFLFITPLRVPKPGLKGILCMILLGAAELYLMFYGAMPL